MLRLFLCELDLEDPSVFDESGLEVGAFCRKPQIDLVEPFHQQMNHLLIALQQNPFRMDEERQLDLY